MISKENYQYLIDLKNNGVKSIKYLIFFDFFLNKNI